MARLLLFNSVALFIRVFGLLSPISGQKPSINEHLEFYDEFREQPSIFYSGGELWIYCRLPGGSKCGQSGTFYLVNTETGKTVSTIGCDKDHLVGGLSIKTGGDDTRMLLGEYRCVFKNRTSDEAIAINYALCSEESDACVNSGNHHCTGDFCIVTLDIDSKKVIHNTPCAKGNLQKVLPSSVCEIHERGNRQQNIFCPAGVRSLCRAMVEGKSGSDWLSALVYSDNCNTDLLRRLNGAYPFITCGGRRLGYDESCLLDQDTEIGLRNTPTVPIDLPARCSLKYEGGGNAGTYATDGPFIEDIWTIGSHEELFRAGGYYSFRKLKFFCDFADQLRLSAFFVIFPNDVKLRVQTTYKPKFGQLYGYCQFNVNVTRAWRSEYRWWKRNDSTNDWTLVRDYNGSNNELPISLSDANSTFRCEGKLTYKTCTPYQLLSRTNIVNYILSTDAPNVLREALLQNGAGQISKLIGTSAAVYFILLISSSLTVVNADFWVFGAMLCREL